MSYLDQRRVPAAFGGIMDTKTGRKKYWLGSIVDWVADKATKYKDLIKLGTSASKAYLDYKDAKRKGELQEAAYADYMREAEAAGKEARAAIDINYTPMTVSGVPTTKADVTDFTAVAAKGGLMSIPNKQRKRYAYGPNPDDFQTEFEMNPPFDPREEGISIGEQVFYNTGRGDRANAKMIWDQMGNDDKSIFDFNFEIFFNNGGWRDMIKGSLDVEQDTKTASHEVNDRILESLYEEHYDRLHGLGHSDDAIHKIIMQMFDDMGAQAPKQPEGIMQAAKGGRIGYEEGTRVADLDAVKDGYSELMFGKPVHELTPDELIELEIMLKDKLGGPFGKKGNAPEGVMTAAQGGRIGYKLGTSSEEVIGLMEKIKTPRGEEVIKEEIEGHTAEMSTQQYQDLVKWLIQMGFSPEEAHKMAAWERDKPKLAKGGRIKKETGGIMDLGGLEKDYRTTGGFVPIGAYEKKDDVPARLSKNEFVFTADAVRAAGGGSINKGAQRMYNTMKHLEAQPTAKRMTV